MINDARVIVMGKKTLKPRILFLTNNPSYYGANHSMATLLCDLKRKQYEIFLILTGHGELEQVLTDNDIPYKVIGYFSQLFYYKWQLKYLSLPFLFIYTLVKFPWVLNEAKKFHPDIIYSNCSSENVGIFIARILGCKHLSHIREFMLEDFSAHFFGGRKSKRAFVNLSDGVIFVSKAIERAVEQGHVDNNKLRVIYNGIPCTHEYQPRKIGDVINLGVVGIFDPAKGQDKAIRYFAKLVKQYPNARLHIWGDKDCPYKRKIYKMVDDLSLKDKIIFHGFKKDPEVIYGDMHILLMCSRSEGFGRVTIEAMQHSIPVIGYNGGGTPEIIKNGENGYLFNNEEEFLHAIQMLLESPDNYKKMNKRAYEFASTSFTVEDYCEQVEQFIYDVWKGTIIEE